MTLPPKPAKIIGWRETVALPSLSIAGINAKIDTGARTSALNARKFKLRTEDGVEWVDFEVPLTGQKTPVLCTARRVDKRPIKNTSGIPEVRHVIETELVLGRHSWKIEVSLANRKEMAFDMILGRTAMRGHRDRGRSLESRFSPDCRKNAPSAEKRL